MCTVKNEQELFNPNYPKVIIDKHGKAVYFSRNTIPFLRDFTKENWLLNHTFYKHIGIYAYRVKFLKGYKDIGQAELEDIEKLEQLRILYAGHKIGVVASTDIPMTGVDTLQDLEKVRKLFLIK